MWYDDDDPYLPGPPSLGDHIFHAAMFGFVSAFVGNFADRLFKLVCREPNLQPNCCEDDRPQEIELDKNALRQIIREEIVAMAQENERNDEE